MWKTVLREYKKHAVSDSCLWSRNEEEASSQEEALNSGLEITELNPLEVEYWLAVSQHQGIKSKDLKHLECGHQSATALLYYVANWWGLKPGLICWWCMIVEDRNFINMRYSLHCIEDSLEVKGAAMEASPSFTIWICSSSSSFKTWLILSCYSTNKWLSQHNYYIVFPWSANIYMWRCIWSNISTDGYLVCCKLLFSLGHHPLPCSWTCFAAWTSRWEMSGFCNRCLLFSAPFLFLRYTLRCIR